MTPAPRLAVRPAPLTRDHAEAMVALLVPLVQREVESHPTMPPAVRQLLVYAAERCLTHRGERQILRAIARETNVLIPATTIASSHLRAGVPKLAVLMRLYLLAVVAALFAQYPRARVSDIAFAAGFSSPQAFARFLAQRRAKIAVYRQDASLYTEWAQHLRPALAHPGWGRVRYYLAPEAL